MGALRSQGPQQKQVVIFTFTGPVSDAERDAWNKTILELKKTFGARVSGVTLKGDDAPAS